MYNSYRGPVQGSHHGRRALEGRKTDPVVRPGAPVRHEQHRFRTRLALADAVQEYNPWRVWITPGRRAAWYRHYTSSMVPLRRTAAMAHVFSESESRASLAAYSSERAFGWRMACEVG